MIAQQVRRGRGDRDDGADVALSRLAARGRRARKAPAPTTGVLAQPRPSPAPPSRSRLTRSRTTTSGRAALAITTLDGQPLPLEQRVDAGTHQRERPTTLTRRTVPRQPRRLHDVSSPSRQDAHFGQQPG